MEDGMVCINYNQKETKRRPGCFNYFSHIIWFLWGQARPYWEKKKKDEKLLKLHGKKVQRHFTHGLSIPHNCRKSSWLAPKPCCKVSIVTEGRCSHAGLYKYWNILSAVWQTMVSLQCSHHDCYGTVWPEHTDYTDSFHHYLTFPQTMCF